MPQITRKINILLASPGNLSFDREKVFDIVKYINLDGGRRHGFVAEVISWETHSRPAAGEYAQQVINDQFPDSIDIFVGLMGTYFGTPTKNWGSGTEEEFRLAHAKWEQTGSPEIMFYFSDAANSVRQIDPNQLAKRNKFRKEIEELGVYYFSYMDITEFQFDLHNHISSAIHKVLNTKEPSESAQPAIEESASALMRYNELLKGDPVVQAVSLIQTSTEHMGEYNKTLLGLTSDVSRLSKATTKEAEKLQLAAAKSSAPLILKSIERITNDMSRYSKSLLSRIPVLSHHFSESILTILRVSSIVKDNEIQKVIPLGIIKQSTLESRNALINLINSVKGVEVILQTWPQDFTDLNIQKKIIMALHHDLSDSLERSIDLLDKLSTELE